MKAYRLKEDTLSQPTLAASLTLILMTAIVWLLLTGTLDKQEVAAGALVIGIVTWLARKRIRILNGVRWSFFLPGAILVYLGYFAMELVRSNFDLARRILSPSLPLRPAVVQVRTELASDLGRMLLANSITLTPGTLTLDVEGDLLTIHWIDCPPGTDIEAATRAIAAGFERHIARFVR